MSTSNKAKLLNVGESIMADNASWTFGGSVPEKFSDHVERSVPWYQAGHEVVYRVSDFFLQDGSTCYELGVSTATLLGKLAQRHAKKKIRFIGIDREEDMIEYARSKTQESPSIELVTADINSYEYEPADLIIAYYTVQFVSPKIRQDLINKIYQSLNWGGGFLFFEKVRACDARFQDMMSTLYVDFKLEQGYGPEEIVAKNRSLKGILEPFSTQGNVNLMKRAGFVDIMTVMKFLCFEGFLAIK